MGTGELSAMQEAAKSAREYGLSVVLAVGVALMLFFVIRWVLRYFASTQSSMANIINVTLVNQTAALNEIKNTLVANNELAREAVRRMREEHDQIRHEHEEILREVRK